MNYWKVGGGILLGGTAAVGAIALSPLFGAVGAITAVGAAVASTLGGAAGGTAAYLTDDEEKLEAEKRTAREEGRNQAKAELSSIFDKMIAEKEARMAHARAQDTYDDLTMAMFTVGCAAFAHCGGANADDMAGLKEFAFGSAHAKLPAAILAQIAAIEAKPPTLKTAHARARKVAHGENALFDQMIVFVADALDAQGKHSLRSNWTVLRAA